MLKVWTSTDRNARLAIQLGIAHDSGYPDGWIIPHDPILSLLSNNDTFVVSLEPISEQVILGNSNRNNAQLLEISRSPINSKVKDNIQYDQRHYGSFVDSIQNFWSILHGDLVLDTPSIIHTQHYVRHKSFKGQASTGTQDLTDISMDLNRFNTDFHLNGYYRRLDNIWTNLDGSTRYDRFGEVDPVYDILPLFHWLSNRESATYIYPDGDSMVTVTISNFHYTNNQKVIFGYHADIIYTVSGGTHFHHYDVSYSSANVRITSEVFIPERIVTYGSNSGLLQIYNHTSDDVVTGNITHDRDGQRAASIVGIPYDNAKFVAEGAISSKLQSLGIPFWNSVELQLFDITALSRDTTTVALNRLSALAYEPSFGRIGAINPLKASGESLLAKTADAALKDAQRGTLKDILGMVGGAGLVRYRTIFSDCLQLTNSLEILGRLKNSPSRLYTANAHYDYQVFLGNRECKIRVRSKAYLQLSPFRLLQILIGKQSIVILNDLLALYYSSQPLGEILLTILQLRKIGDIVGNRMFYDLPLFFVHSYEVESQLSQAELDNTGISTINGDPVRLTYYFRDISQYLPVMRFSNLTPLYGSGDVGDVIWTLLQQLAGVLSSGI